MSKLKNKIKVFWRVVGECMLKAIAPSLMYVSMGLILLLLYASGKISATSTVITWAIVLGVVAAAYNGLLMWVSGGSHYEMLVSGNMKRRSAMQLGSELNITSYKFQKEYRPWKGFVIGAFISVFLIAGAIVFACNQEAVGDADKTSKALGVVVLIFDVFAGWALLPFQVANMAGAGVSYLFALLFALVPIAVSGGIYIAGAYGRRNKTLRQQELAARAAEAEANKPKKINYGGLPGTKPKKRR